LNSVTRRLLITSCYFSTYAVVINVELRRQDRIGPIDTGEVMAQVLVQIERNNLRSIFTQAPAAIAVVRGPDLRYELSNPLHQLLVGGKTVGKTVRETFPEPHVHSVVALMQQAYRSGEPVVIEELPVTLPATANREARQAFISGVLQPLRDSRGQIDGVMVFTYEVTELVVARTRVEQAEERLRLALDAGNVGSWEFRPSNGALECDATFKALFGFAPEASPGPHEITEAIHPEDRERVRKAVVEALQGARGGEYAIECRTGGTAGRRERWISARGRTFFDEAGRAVRFLGTGIDITRERNALERNKFLARAGTVLASSLDYRPTLAQVARLAVPQMADCCTARLIDEKGEIEFFEVIHVDPAKVPIARALRGRASADRDGLTILARVIQTGKPVFVPEMTDHLLDDPGKSPAGDDAAESHPSGCSAAAPAGDDAGLDEEHRRALRALGLCSVMLVPLLGRERVLGTFGFFYAESGRRYAEEDLASAEELARRAAMAIENSMLYGAAQTAIQRRDDFLSVASHELKTPVATLLLQIEGLLCDLERGPFGGDEVCLRLEKSLTQIHRLSNFVNDLLDVARASSGHLRLCRAQMDLTELVRDVVMRFRENAIHTGVPIEIRARVPAVGSWDADRLDQVLTNLLSNALKFAPGQPIAVEVECLSDRVRVGVCDRGPGIAPDDRQRIFDRFEQTRTADGAGGIGLGLWIAREIVRGHGGEITVESEPGQGAAFWVELPR